MPNNPPATPLPWGALEHQHIRPMEDAGYIFHACNAYPQLVEALRDLLVAAHGAAHANESDDANFYNHIHTAHNLLRSLGEKV